MATSVPHNKVYSKIQSSLPGYIDSGNVNLLKDVFDCKISEATKLCVEGAVRDFLLRKICTGENIDLEIIKVVAKICIGGAHLELCLPTLPVLVLSDAFDCITISQCEELFTFVEGNVSVFKEDIFFTPCKNQVLRMCNDVLRRLSRSQNTIFCGRILLFLARFFPFSERSGLNLISEFNLENFTVFTDSETVDVEDDPMEETEKKEEVTKPSLNYTLYTKFWALQDFFRNPIQCYQRASWTLFIKYADDILEAFSSFKLENNNQLEYVKEEIDYDEMTDAEILDEYFPKYLTNQKLLDLQFSDSNFRRYILIQMLILGQYLTASIRFRQEKLSNDQYEWVKKMAEKTYQLLLETPPNGPQFAEIVKQILRREDIWNEWKNRGCSEIKKPGAGIKTPGKGGAPVTNGKVEDVEKEGKRNGEVKTKKRKLGELIKEADSNKKHTMGNAEMTRLWNLCPDNMTACRQEKRDFVPSVETYFMKAAEQLPKKISQKERLVTDTNFGWPGLRLLASKSPHFFTHSTQSINSLAEYLSNMIKKIAKEVPSLHFEEAKVEEDDDVKVIPTEKTEEVTKDEEMEEDEEATEREETIPMTEDEQKILAVKLAKDGDNWKVLGKKLGFQDDDFEFFVSESKSNIEGAIVAMLERWVEGEDDDTSKASIIYTLDGLKLTHITEGLFTDD